MERERERRGEIEKDRRTQRCPDRKSEEAGRKRHTRRLSHKLPEIVFPAPLEVSLKV